MLICVVESTGYLRVGEVENLQLCDAHWEHDAAWDAQYKGTMALGVYKRKQDQIRKGLYPRHGKAVTDRLREFVNWGSRSQKNARRKDLPGRAVARVRPYFPVLWPEASTHSQFPASKLREQCSTA